MKNPLLKLFTLFALVSFSGCGHVGHDDHHGHDHHHNEVVTTIALTLTPADGGTPIVATWADPEGDGSPEIDDIALADGETYTVAVQFLNELENPAEDVTAEVRDEAGEHQIFFTGTAVEGPANTPNASAVVEHVYDDADTDGFPLGLSNTFNAIATGTGVLTVTMRHMPPVNGTPVKTGTLAEIVNSGSVSDLPGSSDISVDFNISVVVHDEDEDEHEGHGHE